MSNRKPLKGGEVLFLTSFYGEDGLRAERRAWSGSVRRVFAGTKNRRIDPPTVVFRRAPVGPGAFPRYLARHEPSRDPDPGDGAAAAPALSRGRLRRLRHAVRRSRGEPPHAAGDVYSRAVLAAHGFPRRALAVPGIRHVGGRGEGDRSVRRDDRLLQSGGLARLRALLDSRAALLGARLRHRGA